MGLLPSVAKTGGNMRFKKKKQIELTEEQKEENDYGEQTDHKKGTGRDRLRQQIYQGI